MVFGVLFAALAFSCLYALLAGTVRIELSQLFAVFGGSETGLPSRIVLELRLPRALSAFSVGALLALAGVLLQVLLRNPLADPYILGISGGAAVGALGAMLLSSGRALLNASAMIGALLSMLLVFGIAHGHGSWSSTRLLLTGVVVAAGWAALVSFMLAVAPETNLRGMLFWLMGDLSYDAPYAWGLGMLAVGLLASMLIARNLNILVRGDLQATALGVNAKVLRVLVYVLASALCAVAVTIGGTIGFIGLVVPHMLRLIGVTDHRSLIPAAALLGGSLLLSADTLARTVMAPQQLPVGVLTAMLGVPLFLVLLYHGARKR
ncbi:MAG: iron ABC transporter permease [Gammaproteobacteria bacterium]|nr:iron ABC transporter permease [Gammaproteobacteria bacterium]